jgi:hypothetical protein
MAKNNYEKYIARNVINVLDSTGPIRPDMQNSPFVASSPELMKAIQGAMPSFAIYYVLKEGMFLERPHYHTNDEYLFFISSDPHDMKNLGATVQVAYGEEWGKVEFSTSALVYFPKNLQHMPLHVKNMKRPFLFGHFWPMAEETNFILAK